MSSAFGHDVGLNQKVDLALDFFAKTWRRDVACSSVPRSTPSQLSRCEPWALPLQFRKLRQAFWAIAAKVG